ncbi:MAG: hypothetical protein Unbinned8472contig1000_79 [Prokaryotic dsDNA virus sp.]|nr:MAG: hypothetical protein Unbinned8472contig1000_79 [Prokaryotic dsDNA virus sp.]|tara:strand:+ start:36307 stop:36558 length:252 start_codon:yes stop_codon:yes gene_type:complete
MDSKYKIVGNWAIFDGMIWPMVNDIEWKLRHAPETLTVAEEMHVASIVGAYTQLVYGMTQKDRNARCEELKAAQKLFDRGVTP